jgi:hypothetical protein
MHRGKLVLSPELGNVAVLCILEFEEDIALWVGDCTKEIDDAWMMAETLVDLSLALEPLWMFVAEGQLEDVRLVVILDEISSPCTGLFYENASMTGLNHAVETM